MNKIDSDLKKNISHIVENVPFLFKYMNSESGKLLLRNSSLQISNPNNFNDPYDCDPELMTFEKPNIESLKKKLFKLNIEKFPNDKSNLNLERLTEYEVKSIFKKIFSKYTNAIGVTCFSECYNDILMWSHYGNSHTGICFGFDLLKLYSSLKKNTPSNISILKVEYTKDFLPNDFFNDEKTAILKWVSTKALNWTYEKEIRILLTKINFDSSGKFLMKFDMQCLTSIFLGSKMKLEDKEFYINYVRDNIPHIQIYEIKKELNSFKLVESHIEI